MNSIWLSLLWKEWCEQRWKIMAFSSILIVASLLMFAISLTVRGWDRFGVVNLLFYSLGVMMFYAPVAGFFLGISAAGGENSRSTMRFARSLPLPMWQVACWKLLMAVVAAVLPICLTAMVVWGLTLIFDPTGESRKFVEEQFRLELTASSSLHWYLARTLVAIAGTTSIVIWIAAGGVNRADEVRAGIVGFLVVAIVWAAGIFCLELAARHQWLTTARWLNLSQATLPGAPALSQLQPQSVRVANSLLSIMIALVGHTLVGYYYVSRFGKTTTMQQLSKGMQVSDLLNFKSGRPPLKSQWLAITWKQLRETTPLAFLAIIAIFFVSAGIAYLDRNTFHPGKFAIAVASITCTAGALVTAVAAIGVLYEDYSKGIETFWRSRPINLNLWFAAKVVTGLLVLVVTLGSPLLWANWLVDGRLGGLEDIKIIPMLFVLIYALSLASYSIVRQPIYAAVLAAGTSFSMPIVIELLDWATGVGPIDRNQWVFWLGVVMACLATLLAWQAVVRDWGWKQHR
jgi:hypothetical protein